MKYIERVVLAFFLLTCCCAGPRHGRGPRSHPPKIVLPGRPAPCTPYCVPL